MVTEEETLYDKLVAAGCEIDNHYSDLYVKATPEARAIIKAAGKRSEAFQSQVDGEMWLDVPFAYSPYWRARGGA